jgi:hypothetical protein
MHFIQSKSTNFFFLKPFLLLFRQILTDFILHSLLSLNNIQQQEGKGLNIFFHFFLLFS